MHQKYQALYALTWHYILVKPSPRLLKYQALNPHGHAATVEDQLKDDPFRSLAGELKLFKTDGYAVVSDSLHQHVIRVLTEENPRTNFFIEQNIIDPAK